MDIPDFKRLFSVHIIQFTCIYMYMYVHIYTDGYALEHHWCDTGGYVCCYPNTFLVVLPYAQGGVMAHFPSLPIRRAGRKLAPMDRVDFARPRNHYGGSLWNCCGYMSTLGRPRQNMVGPFIVHNGIRFLGNAQTSSKAQTVSTSFAREQR